MSPRTEYSTNIAKGMRQAMVFAAGLGTRLRPLTDTMPKALVRIGGAPLLGHVLHRLQDAGFGRVVINVHHFPDQIIDFVGKQSFPGMEILISDERDGLLETGGGLRKAAHYFSDPEPVLIHNVDILSNVDLDEFYKVAAHNDATLLVSERKTNRYLLFDDDMRLMGWTNIATGEVRSPHEGLDPLRYRHLAFAGIHVVSRPLLDMMESWPERFGIIDFYLDRCAEVQIMGVQKDNLRIMDVGKINTLSEAEGFLNSLKK